MVRDAPDLRRGGRPGAGGAGRPGVRGAQRAVRLGVRERRAAADAATSRSTGPQLCTVRLARRLVQGRALVRARQPDPALRVRERGAASRRGRRAGHGRSARRGCSGWRARRAPARCRTSPRSRSGAPRAAGGSGRPLRPSPGPTASRRGRHDPGAHRSRSAGSAAIRSRAVSSGSTAARCSAWCHARSGRPASRPDERHRIPLAMRCLLVEHPDGLVLIDTALGNKEDGKFLDIYGVENAGLEGATPARGRAGLGRVPARRTCAG